MYSAQDFEENSQNEIITTFPIYNPVSFVIFHSASHKHVTRKITFDDTEYC